MGRVIWPMHILKDNGTFEILDTPEELTAQLLNIERAGRTCYQSYTGEVTPESAAKFVRMILKRGHESVIEHSKMTVVFRGCSRGVTHELVRHRLCAFSQESTRYVDYAKGAEGPDLERFQANFVVPPHRDETESINIPVERIGMGMVIGNDQMTIPDVKSLQMAPVQIFELYEACYRALRKAGWKAEDARQFLPIGTESEIVTTANWRQWRHIFKMRTGKAAHWEIRAVMCRLLAACQTFIPVVFDDFVLAGEDARGVPYYEKRPRFA